MLRLCVVLSLALVGLALVPEQWPACTFHSDDGKTTYDVTILDAPGGIIPAQSVGIDETMYYNYCSRVGPYWDCNDCSNFGQCSKDAANIEDQKDYDFCIDTGFCCYQYGNGTDMVGPNFNVQGEGTWELIFSPEDVDSPYRRTNYLFICDQSQKTCKPKVKLGSAKRDSDGKKYEYANITVECDVACGIPTPPRFQVVQQEVCSDKACSTDCQVNNFTTGTCLLNGDGGSIYMKLCDDALGLVQVYYEDNTFCKGEGYQYANPTNSCLKAGKNEFFSNTCRGESAHSLPSADKTPRSIITKPTILKK